MPIKAYVRKHGSIDSVASLKNIDGKYRVA